MQKEGEVAALRSERHILAVGRVLGPLFAEAGVKQGLCDAAVALLSEKHTFEFEESDSGGDDKVMIVKDKAGFLHSPDAAIAAFLDSEDRQALRGANPAPKPGYFGPHEGFQAKQVALKLP